MTLSNDPVGSAGQRRSFIDECWGTADPFALGQRGVSGSGNGPPAIPTPAADPSGPGLAQGGPVSESPSKQASDAQLTRWPVGWGEESIYAYLERLGVAEDLGMDVAPGSPAEQIAAREARRVATGLPPAWPSSRDGDVLDALLVHSGALGGLRFVRLVDDAEQVWGGPSIAKPSPQRLELLEHRGVDLREPARPSEPARRAL